MQIGKDLFRLFIKHTPAVLYLSLLIFLTLLTTQTIVVMENILHRIKANLYENVLTDDANDYLARVSSERTLNVKEICSSAVSRGGADVSASTMEHCMDLFLGEMGYLLSDGFSVNTGYFTATPLIKGVFNSPTEKFSSDKHSVLFQFNQGATLRNMLSNISVEIMGVAESGISIAQVTDVKTGLVNDQITPNRNLRIKGSKLKVVGDNESIGIYFVNETTNERIKVDPSDIVTNNPSELIIITPELTKGGYTLEVVSQYGVSVMLKEPRTAV